MGASLKCTLSTWLPFTVFQRKKFQRKMSGRTEDISGLKGENRRGNWEAPRTTLTHMICLALALACFLLGGILWTSRHYKTKPTHGIGRYRHLVKVQEPKKKKAKVELRAINVGTDYEYGVLNIHLTAYDMSLAESYAQYVHRLCNRLSIKVEESYAMPTKTMEVMRLPDQGNKMVLDSVLTTHERVVQISGLSATFAEIFLEVLQSNLPEGVRLSVREHTEEDFKGRFKARPELEELLAKLN